MKRAFLSSIKHLFLFIWCFGLEYSITEEDDLSVDEGEEAEDGETFGKNLKGNLWGLDLFCLSLVMDQIVNLPATWKTGFWISGF